MSLGFPKPPEWADLGRCSGVDTELFYPTSTKHDASDPALWYCRRCDVREQCLEYALEQPMQHGVWGGMTDIERTILLRERRKEQYGLGNARQVQPR